MERHLSVFVFVERLLLVEDAEGQLIGLLSHQSDHMAESNNDILYFSLDLQDFWVFKLEGCILASETKDPAFIAAVEAVVFGNAHNLEPLGELDELKFSIVDELVSLGESDGSVRRGDNCEKGLRLQSLHDQIGRMHLGVLRSVIGQDGNPSIEQLPKLRKLRLIETIGERVVLLEVLAEEEVVLLGKYSGGQQVLQRQVLSDILQDLPPVEQVLSRLHTNYYQRITKINILIFKHIGWMSITDRVWERIELTGICSLGEIEGQITGRK